MNLSEAHRQILELLAAGHSYEQVLASNPKLTFQDLAAAARSALEGIGSGGGGTTYSLEEIRKHYPNAYQPWTAAEEARLLEMLESGGSFKAIADINAASRKCTSPFGTMFATMVTAPIDNP